MTDPAGRGQGALVTLAPHQSAFVDGFFSTQAPRAIVLSAAPGTGKSTALVALLERVLQGSPEARVLLVAPAALLEHLVDKLRRQGVRALEIDRYRFRELLDSAGSDPVWPAGVVCALSASFARQDDVLEKLEYVPWELVVEEDAGPPGGLGAASIARLARRARRFVISTRTDLGSDYASAIEGATTIRWGTDSPAMRFALHEIMFKVSPREVDLGLAVYTLRRALGASTKGARSKAALLSRCLLSSPAALEGVLRGIKISEGALGTLERVGPNAGAERIIAPQGRGVGHGPRGSAIDLVESALSVLEEVGRDSKLEAFRSFLEKRVGSDVAHPRTCIVAEFAETLFYLAAGIEAVAPKALVMDPGMSTERRFGMLEQFEMDGGILAATFETLQGLEVVQGVELVFYDTPKQQLAIEAFLARFSMRRRVMTPNLRAAPQNIYALVPAGLPGGPRRRSSSPLKRALLPHGADSEAVDLGE